MISSLIGLVLLGVEPVYDLPLEDQAVEASQKGKGRVKKVKERRKGAEEQKSSDQKSIQGKKAAQRPRLQVEVQFRHEAEITAKF